MENAEIQTMFSVLGPVTIKPMFGGKGIYYQGSIIAVEFAGDVLLKADHVSAPAFAAAGAAQWAYEGRTGKAVNMPYWSIPADAFDESDAMARWVRLAYDAALRAARASRK